MKFFSLLKGEPIHLAPDQKVVPAEEFSTLQSAQEILEMSQAQSLEFRQAVTEECEQLKEQSQEAGFEEGLSRWNDQIAYLVEEKNKIRKEIENEIVPLALAAVKKIIGKELELRPDAVVDIIATALKNISHQHRISLFVNKNDLEIVEAHRTRLKNVFEELHSFTISARDDVEQGGCVIETEVGIINAQLNSQLKALESAFHSFLHHHHKKEAG